MPVRIERSFPGPYYILPGVRLIGNILEFLGERASSNGEAFSVHEAVIEEHFEHRRHASRAMEVHRNVASGRFQVAQHGYLLAYALEVVDRPFDACGVRDGKIVKDRVSRAAGRH